ncbi:hypothetical protein OC846_001633 [Tilletia horrida]|uniref:Uncharacterized protein n=1 Tax=Tilletia horrida TaxID=155126 RepID=A0AAN6GTK6_9BASI|nr:hypothetical protein OC845_003027 [Tilletia horrida]KAK0555668.1 hypothetical protein OC846_001633 [Tilletia horrida]KAK0568570.1 hypothetical protein OC861_001818 [Tilletia horrida]
MGMIKQDTSGITPFALVAICAGIGAAFILAIAVAFICKAVNRPTEEAMPYLINGRGALYQPSAAGYGARQGAGQPGKGGQQQQQQLGGDLTRSPSIASQSRTNLLSGAQPMGRDDSFNTAFNASNDNLSRTHTRGTSSSISKNPFPGPPMAARRPGFGPGGGHPPLPGQTIAPDGSGFAPGQLFRGPGGSSPLPSPGGYSSGPGGPGFLNGFGQPGFLSVNPSLDLPRTSRETTAPNNNRMSMVSMARGPPPATAESRRRSRYSRIGGPDGMTNGNRQSRRIDSVGPGVLRKSMFLNADAQFPGLEALQRTGSNQGAPQLPPHQPQTSFYQQQPPASSPQPQMPVLPPQQDANGGNAPTLRRVESVNRGDPRRRSNYVTNGRPLGAGGDAGGLGRRPSAGAPRPSFDPHGPRPGMGMGMGYNNAPPLPTYN